MVCIWSRRKQWSLTPPGLFDGLKLPLPALPRKHTVQGSWSSAPLYGSSQAILAAVASQSILTPGDILGLTHGVPCRYGT